MATFSAMPALSSGPTPADALGLSAAAGQMGIEGFDPELNFDDSLLDTVNNGLPQLPFTPAYDFEPFAANFEDPFAYPGRAFAEGPSSAGLVLSHHHHQRHHHHHTPDAGVVDSFPDNEDSPSNTDQLDNKLLGFSVPIAKASLIDGETGTFAEVGMTAELYGMFFVAEDVFGGDTGPGRPLELTCYRRNLWQCSGQVTLPRHVSHAVVGEQGDRQVNFTELTASITAIESIEGKPTEIISIPWKSANPAPTQNNNGNSATTANANNSNNNTTTTTNANANANTNTNGNGSVASSNGGGGGEKAEEAAVKVTASPPHVTLDLASGTEADGNRVTIPVSWKRLQFKHATANNGRRKGLQQHYVVQINLLGKTEAGEVIKIAEIQSGPVIVRGRSPRNFDSRKDVPLTGDKKLERRNTSTSNDGGNNASAGSLTPIKEGRGDLAQNMRRYHSLGNVQSTADWAQAYGSTSPHAAKKMALSSPGLNRPPVPSWSVMTGGDPSMGGSSRPVPATPRPLQRQSTLPINLSLSEDERSPNRSGSDTTSPQFAKAVPAAQASNSHNSPLESADLLYEYFPLSLDDWMPPVDAIYRPHVVHHTIMPPEVKAQQVRNKNKRYFSAE